MKIASSLHFVVLTGQTINARLPMDCTMLSRLALEKASSFVLVINSLLFYYVRFRGVEFILPCHMRKTLSAVGLIRILWDTIVVHIRIWGFTKAHGLSESKVNV